MPGTSDDAFQDYRNEKLDLKILKSLLPRFRPHLSSLIICGALLAAFSLFSLAGPLLVRHAIDVVFPAGDLIGLTLVSSLFLIIIVVSFWINYLQQVKLEIVGQKIVKSIRTDVFSHLTRLEQTYFDKNPVGNLLSRVESDTEALRTLFTYTVITMLSDFLLMIGMFVVMFVLNPPLTGVLFCVVPIVVLIVKYFNRRIVPIFLEVRRRTAEVYAFLEEFLRGSSVVQVFDQEETVSQRMNNVNKAKVDVEYPGERLSNYFGHMVFLLSMIATSLILGTGGAWIIKGYQLLTIGTLVAFLGYIQRFFGPIFHLSEQINVIQRAFAGAKRIDQILKTPAPETAAEHIDPHNRTTTSKHTFQGIEFTNVWFSYNDNNWVLKNVSFKIPRGRNIAVVGPTGSGKTTLISLLFRFYTPQKGTISIDGIDIQSMTIQDLRKRLGLVLQDIVLFPGSIRDNLTLEDHAIPDDKIIKALHTINAQDLVERSPDGLNGRISEQGSNFSMGERQLLSFARAMIADPEILILDEATSSVDPLTEHRLQDAVATVLQGRTALIIAHRLQTISQSNLIIVLHNGQVIQTGSHTELLGRDGVYKQLYQIQLGNGISTL